MNKKKQKLRNALKCVNTHQKLHHNNDYRHTMNNEMNHPRTTEIISPGVSSDRKSFATNTAWRSSSSEYDYPALCIPRSVASMSTREIEQTFNRSGLGVVSKVVVKPKKHILNEWEQIVNENTKITEVDYSNIYVYFRKWNTDDPNVVDYRKRLLQGRTIKIVFETLPTPVFWRCVAAKF